MIPTDGVKWKLDEVVHSVPPDEGCKVLDEGVRDAEWDKSDNKNVADSDAFQIVIKMRGQL